MLGTERPSHQRPDVVEIHRAIGGYVTAFSEVVAVLRQGIDIFLAPIDVKYRRPDPLLEILFAQMTADPIRAAFFAISSQVGDLNDDDRSIRKALQALVQHYIRLRNDIAHADWSVGWMVAETGASIPPAAYRVKVAKDGVEHTSLPYTPEQIAAEIAHLHYLRRALGIWATACRRRQVGDLPTRPSDLLSVYRTSEKVGTAVEVPSIPPK
jgi:hypothetical protein